MIFTVVFTIIAASLSMYCSTLTEELGGFMIESLPLLLIGTFCGYIPGITAVFLNFIYHLIVDQSTAYLSFISFTAVIIASRAAKKNVFGKLWKTLLFGAVIAFLLGAVNDFLLNITSSGQVYHGIYLKLLISFVYALPECEVASLIAFFVFNYLPMEIKKYIPNGIYYLKDYEDILAFIEERIKAEFSKISFRVMRVVVLEAFLLTVLACVVAIHLVDTMNTDAINEDKSQFEEHLPVSDNTAFMIREGEEGSGPGVSDNMTDPSEQKITAGPRHAGILGEGGWIISDNGVFDDSIHFNPFMRNERINSRMKLAFAFRLAMILFSAGIVTAAFADNYMQYTVARPIRKMSEAMNGFAFSEHDGSIGGTEALSKIKIKTKDEIADLHRALVKTVEDTESYLERLREEDRMKNELEVAKASNEAKSVFLSSMSHEIRTPINAVLGFDEMILMENRDPEIEKYAEDIQSAGKTLLALVNDILDFSKIEAGKMEIVPVQYELSSTINDVVNMTSTLTRDKGLYFDVNVDPKTPHLLYGDEIRIKQCITNILSNAAKYTEKGGVTFDVGFETIPEEADAILLNISVKDTGIGIKEEDMDKLFSAFDRLDQVRNKAVKGTGLGMSITKQLLENMGSSLEVKSEYEKGSDFHFSVKQIVTRWEEIGPLTEAYKKYLPHEGADKKNDNFRAPEAEILVVDDTANNLLVVTRLLKRTGIKIDTADSGYKTLELITKKKYDLIYIDHMMPEMDGIETFHKMKDLEGNMNINTPVIVLTANAVSGSRDMYMNEGFSDYMTKPVSYLELKSSLIKYLPDEKIESNNDIDAGQDNILQDERNTEENLDEKTASVLSGIQGIDVDAGIKYSGDEETLIEVIKGYSDGIDESADKIEKELSDLEIKNYTIHVHALKSSSRLIGAGNLSDMALEMENTGNDYQQAISGGDTYKAAESLAKLEEKTPELLALYRSYKEKLAPVVNAGKDNTKELPELTEEELREMLLGIREFAEAFDMDSVDSTMNMIEAYSIPEESRDIIDDLKKSVRNVDRDAILDLLENI